MWKFCVTCRVETQFLNIFDTDSLLEIANRVTCAVLRYFVIVLQISYTAKQYLLASNLTFSIPKCYINTTRQSITQQFIYLE